ncbi:rho-related GTP-binding protein RhoU-like [Onthophagus taurus]|uniref:rho-related GTP-binding protein RhoU-like n=1 Tax=Onthophagus taurus TaxID=166361 RepID=UPI000C20066E|nr:rho-related GTP-binding protein RhoU-like [Onthophagus taurus]
MTPQAEINTHYTKPLLKQANQIHVRKAKPPKEKNERVKCVILGDTAVGKTSLVVSYSNDTFPTKYVPTAYDNYKVVVQVDGEPVRVELCDTAGEDENPLRTLCYPGADVIILCFSIVNPTSFHSIHTRWLQEVQALKVPVVLVGTQSDLLSNQEVIRRLRQNGETAVSPTHARRLAAKLNAPYVETSARTCSHLKEAFDVAITLGLKRQLKMKRPKWKKYVCCF